MQTLDLITNTNQVIGAVLLFVSFLSSAAWYFNKVYRKIKAIYLLLVPNGGSSLADTINQIRENQQIGQTRTQILWEHQPGVGYYECDAETGLCTHANNTLTDLFGLSLEEFLGFGWLRAVESQVERDRIYKSWIAAVKDRIPYEVEYFINVRGTRTKVKTRAWACRDKKTGKTLKMFGTLEVVSS